MAAYLKLEGIVGDSKEADHVGWIEVRSWSVNPMQGFPVHNGDLHLVLAREDTAFRLPQTRRFHQYCLLDEVSPFRGVVLKLQFENLMVTSQLQSGVLSYTFKKGTLVYGGVQLQNPTPRERSLISESINRLTK